MAEQAVERLHERSRALTLSPAWQLAGWWAGSRALVFACAALLHWQRTPHGYFEPEFRSTLTVLSSWDGRWYDQVARNGYLLVPGHQSDPAFFPFYPMLLRIVHVFGLSYEDAGIALSNLVLLGGLLAFYRPGRELLPERDAFRAGVVAAGAQSSRPRRRRRRCAARRSARIPSLPRLHPLRRARQVEGATGVG